MPGLPASRSLADHAAARLGVLFARLADLRTRLIAAEGEDDAAAALEGMEQVTIEIAETSAPRSDACLHKAALLRERLLDVLDPGVSSEAVTLALVASLVLDLARLDG